MKLGLLILSFVCVQKTYKKELDESDLLAVPSSFVKRDELYVKEGDILISTANSWELVGKCVRVKTTRYKSTIGGFISMLRPKVGLVDPDYLFYFLSMDKTQKSIRHLGKQTTNISNLDRVGFLQLKIPLPPLETQKQIAAVLEKADQLRKDCKLLEQELNSLAQSVFIDMFGDPVTNPKGWKLASLSSLGVVNGGLQVTSKRSGNPISVPYLRVANVYRDFLKLDEVKDILVTSKELERAALKKGDLLFVEGHGNANELGRAAVWNNEIEKCVHQNHLIRFRPGTEIRPQYVSSFVNSAAGKRQLLSMSKTTSGLNTLSASNISSLEILVPPLLLQDKYLEIVTGILKQKNDNLQLANELDGQFNALMQKAFSGELNLDNAKT
ncbi:MAG: restriction endonuclease subunit S [Shewanella xiamenensis]|nr:restriction endonuclease subunit S [Shewanella xiamenensis]